MKHNAYANAMLDLERAINKAYKIAEYEFMHSLHINGCNKENDEWYRAMTCLKAMTNIKCTIHVEWSREGE